MGKPSEGHLEATANAAVEAIEQSLPKGASFVLLVTSTDSDAVYGGSRVAAGGEDDISEMRNAFDAFIEAAATEGSSDAPN
jgi:hypothetical protein